jgi:hypothetical protein
MFTDYTVIFHEARMAVQRIGAVGQTGRPLRGATIDIKEWIAATVRFRILRLGHGAAIAVNQTVAKRKAETHRALQRDPVKRLVVQLEIGNRMCSLL